MAIDELARERAGSAHRRLDVINGHLRRLGDEAEETKIAVAGIHATLSLALRIAGAVSVALLGAMLTVIVLLVTRNPQPPSSTGSHKPSVAISDRGAENTADGRERGLHEGRSGT